MIAAAYAAGLITGAAVVLMIAARQGARANRDRQAFNQHLAMVRALGTVASPRRTTP